MGETYTLHAELIERDGEAVGVMTVVDGAGNRVGAKCAELRFGKMCLGAKLSFHAYMQVIQETPGASKAFGDVIANADAIEAAGLLDALNKAREGGE